MKDVVNVAAVQMDIAWLQPEKNIERMVAYVEQIAERQPTDLIIFPELANTGFVKGWDPDFGSRYIRAAETIPGPTTEALGAAARKYGVYIIVGICEQHPRIPASLYDAAALLGPSGAVLGVYHKVHLAGEEKHYFYPGNSLPVFHTDIGCLGIAICYDTVFPELTRALALQGAEILCAPYNAPKLEPYVPEFLERLAGARANENKNYVVMVNRVGVQEDKVFYGRSVISGPYAEVMTQSLGETEEVLCAKLERARLIRSRARTPIFQDRRAGLYGLLLKDAEDL